MMIIFTMIATLIWVVSGCCGDYNPFPTPVIAAHAHLCSRTKHWAHLFHGLPRWMGKSGGRVNLKNVLKGLETNTLM